MRQLFEKPIPVGLFFLVIMLACIGYGVSFYRQGDHFQRMDAFMAKGDRFTGQDGRNMAVRIEVLEERLTLLEANCGH